MVTNKNVLANRLNDFYKDYDYYDYMDKLSGNEEDTINDLAGQLDDPDAVSGIMSTLLDIQANGGLSEAQKLVLGDLLLDVSELLVDLSSGKELDTVLSTAVKKASQQKYVDAVKDKEDYDYGK